MNRYNVKYRVVKIKNKNTRRYIHDEIEGSVCYPAYLNIGERGWLLYCITNHEDVFSPVQKLHTSKIKCVIYSDEEHSITIETKNTIYYLEVITNEQE